MDNWLQAEKELSYRLKQELHKQLKNGSSLQVAKMNSIKIVKPEIELRAFILYCNKNSDPIENWTSCEHKYIYNDKYNHSYDKILPEIKQYANWIYTEGSLEMFDRNIAYEWALIEFINVAAYFRWENKYNIMHELQLCEKCFEHEIKKEADKISKAEPYLSDEEALSCARDKLYKMIQLETDKKIKWVSERAYYLSEEKPNNSKEENWYLAVDEYYAKHSKR